MLKGKTGDPHAIYQHNARLLALLVMIDRADQNSFFRYYWDVLPYSYPTLPTYWPCEAFDALKGEARFSLVQQHIAMVSAWLEEGTKLGNFTYEDFQWALSTVWSRSYLSKRSVTPLLVPLADMLNQADHLPADEHVALIEYYDHPTRGFALVTNCPYGKGDQVWSSYGKRSLFEFVQAYGFTVEAHAALPQVDVLLILPLEELEPSLVLFERKKQLLEKLGMYWRSHHFPIDLDQAAFVSLPENLVRSQLS